MYKLNKDELQKIFGHEPTADEFEIKLSGLIEIYPAGSDTPLQIRYTLEELLILKQKLNDLKLDSKKDFDSGSLGLRTVNGWRKPTKKEHQQIQNVIKIANVQVRTKNQKHTVLKLTDDKSWEVIKYVSNAFEFCSYNKKMHIVTDELPNAKIGEIYRRYQVHDAFSQRIEWEKV